MVQTRELVQLVSCTISVINIFCFSMSISPEIFDLPKGIVYFEMGLGIIPRINTLPTGIAGGHVIGLLVSGPVNPTLPGGDSRTQRPDCLH